MSLDTLGVQADTNKADVGEHHSLFPVATGFGLLHDSQALVWKLEWQSESVIICSTFVYSQIQHGRPRTISPNEEPVGCGCWGRMRWCFNELQHMACWHWSLVDGHFPFVVTIRYVVCRQSRKQVFRSVYVGQEVL